MHRGTVHHLCATSAKSPPLLHTDAAHAPVHPRTPPPPHPIATFRCGVISRKPLHANSNPPAGAHPPHFLIRPTFSMLMVLMH